MIELAEYRRFAVRDAVVIGATVAIACLDSRLREAGASGMWPSITGVSTGALAALSGFLCHEWGHLLGARAAGGSALPPKQLTSFFLFFFDVSKSDRRAFLWMSYGGYVASAIAVPAVVLLLPWNTLAGKVATVSAVLGMLVTAALEVPTTVRVARGGPLPSGGVFVDETRRPRAASEPAH